MATKTKLCNPLFWAFFNFLHLKVLVLVLIQTVSSIILLSLSHIFPIFLTQKQQNLVKKEVHHSLLPELNICLFVIEISMRESNLCFCNRDQYERSYKGSAPLASSGCRWTTTYSGTMQSVLSWLFYYHYRGYASPILLPVWSHQPSHACHRKGQCMIIINVIITTL